MNTIAPRALTPVPSSHTTSPPAAPSPSTEHPPAPTQAQPRGLPASYEVHDLVPTIKETRLVDDGNLTAHNTALTFQFTPQKKAVMEDSLTLETGDRSDTIHVSNGADGRLNVEVNGKAYAFNVRSEKEGNPTQLYIKSKAGDDRIKIDADVMLPVSVEAGDGNDSVTAGGGPSRLFGGNGNDRLQLGSGPGYAEGNEGDDTIMGGTGNAILYGNNGNDRLYAGHGPANKKSHLDGGSGADHLYAGNGHTVMNGGKGDDLMVGHDRTTFYSAKGKDTIRSNNRTDRIYGKTSDRVIAPAGATFVPITPDESGKKGINVQGTPDFKQRVEDDLDLLRSSPVGQKMLAALDDAAIKNGAPINIKSGAKEQFDLDELQKEKTQYVVEGEHVDDSSAPLAQEDPESPKNGFIRNGVRGTANRGGAIFYDPSSLYDNPVLKSSPVTNFYHEMSHAYNGATGSFLPGSTPEQVGDKPAADTPNAERQAVGLPTSAEPFDFDNDPLTPPTSTNPTALTENAIREEMGHDRRDNYRVQARSRH